MNWERFARKWSWRHREAIQTDCTNRTDSPSAQPTPVPREYIPGKTSLITLTAIFERKYWERGLPSHPRRTQHLHILVRIYRGPTFRNMCRVTYSVCRTRQDRFTCLPSPLRKNQTSHMEALPVAVTRLAPKTSLITSVMVKHVPATADLFPLVSLTVRTGVAAHAVLTQKEKGRRTLPLAYLL
jgi:hypothetical protein